jgi:hypothetical protein
MREPLYLAYYGYAIVAGCVVGCVWFMVIVSVESKNWDIFAVFPLYELWLFDSFLFGWFPALLFGMFLHFVMFRFGWLKFWQWALVGACMAWTLFVVGGWMAKSDVLSILSLGLGLLRNGSSHSWPAAICGSIVALVLRPLAIRWANPLAPAKQTA